MGIQIVGGLIHRKCDECKRTLVIDRNNSTNCILFDGKAFAIIALSRVALERQLIQEQKRCGEKR